MQNDPIRALILSLCAKVAQHLSEAGKLANCANCPLGAEQAEAIAAELEAVRQKTTQVLDRLEPLWQVRLAPDLTPELRAALDLSTWDHNEGVTSAAGPICPHCNAPENRDLRGLQGYAHCQACGEKFWFHETTAPHCGPAWSTWKKNPRTFAKGGAS